MTTVILALIGLVFLTVFLLAPFLYSSRISREEEVDNDRWGENG